MEIFNDVVSIVTKDYSGFIDKEGWGRPEDCRAIIQKHIDEGSMTPTIFESVISEFLLDYKDAHMYFRLVGNSHGKVLDIGFEVRRFEDKLYVTSVGNEQRLKPGDAIISIEGMSISALAEKHRNQVEYYGQGHEREVWKPIIMKYSRCTVLDSKGKIFDLELSHYDPTPYIPQYSCESINESVVLIKLSDFSNSDAISKMIADNTDTINNAGGLIIDVRHNRGGSDSAYFKLLEYVFDREVNLKNMDNTPMQINMTERNYNLRVNEFSKMIETIEDQSTKDLLITFIKIMDKHKDQGLVEVNLLDLLPDTIIKGSDKPENIVVLTDVYCGSSGDAFVDIASKSKKVTIMGRPTAGVTDYSNLAVQRYDGGFVFMYPTSRNMDIDKGRGISGKGHLPHVYIPWSNEHINKDVDLDRAIEFITDKLD